MITTTQLSNLQGGEWFTHQGERYMALAHALHSRSEEGFVEFVYTAINVRGQLVHIAESTFVEIDDKDLRNDPISHPVLYQVDSMIGEATGIVHWFCCDKCREEGDCKIPLDHGIALSKGNDSNASDGTVCENCLRVLRTATPNNELWEGRHAC